MFKMFKRCSPYIEETLNRRNHDPLFGAELQVIGLQFAFSLCSATSQLRISPSEVDPVCDLKSALGCVRSCASSFHGHGLGKRPALCVTHAYWAATLYAGLQFAALLQ